MLYHLGDGTILTFTAKIRHLRDMIMHGLSSESAIQVQILQVLLNASGCCEAQSVDGVFTDKVTKCVSTFQEANRLEVTGIADKQTVKSSVLLVARAQPADPPSPFLKNHTVNNNSTTGTPRAPYSEMKGQSSSQVSLLEIIEDLSQYLLWQKIVFEIQWFLCTVSWRHYKAAIVSVQSCTRSYIY
jgi:hypothetical protein